MQWKAKEALISFSSVALWKIVHNLTVIAAILQIHKISLKLTYFLQSLVQGTCNTLRFRFFICYIVFFFFFGFSFLLHTKAFHGAALYLHISKICTFIYDSAACSTKTTQNCSHLFLEIFISAGSEHMPRNVRVSIHTHTHTHSHTHKRAMQLCAFIYAMQNILAMRVWNS